MTTSISEPHVYRYLAPSDVNTGAHGTTVGLATSGGCADHPWLAEGFLATPQPAARALLLVATLAGTRFWMPPNMVAAAIAASDPVVTASPDALRFEAFSLCCGVYARFDLDAGALDGTVHRHGTTNVDVNPPLRAALSRIGARDPLRLQVGRDELAVTTLDARVVEKKVPLPQRWVRGFAESALAVAGAEPRFELRAAGLRQFLDTLPTTTTRGANWVAPSGSSARLATRSGAGAIAAGGLERLRALKPLAPYLKSVTAFEAPGATSVWSGELDGGRVSVVLSPAPARAMSGEGGLLAALAGTGTGARRAMAQIEQAASGRLGYDVARAEWFERDLPFARDALDEHGTRLTGARAIVAAGGVRFEHGGDSATITSGADSYGVRRVDGEWRCTCPWFGKHRHDRGPCRHILAAVLDCGDG